MSLIDRVKNILLSPAKEWDVIATETPDPQKIITGYVLPLVILSALASFIGYGLVGVNVGFIKMSGINWGIYYALSVLVSSLLSIFLGAFIIDALAPSFSSEKNMPRSIQLVAYSYTPGFVGGLLAVLPVLSFIGALLSLYGLYLLYIGLPKLKKTPVEKQTGYFVASLVVMIILYAIIGVIMSRVLMPAFGLSTDINIPSIRVN